MLDLLPQILHYNRTYMSPLQFSGARKTTGASRRNPLRRRARRCFARLRAVLSQLLMVAAPIVLCTPAAGLAQEPQIHLLRGADVVEIQAVAPNIVRIQLQPNGKTTPRTLVMDPSFQPVGTSAVHLEKSGPGSGVGEEGRFCRRRGASENGGAGDGRGCESGGTAVGAEIGPLGRVLFSTHRSTSEVHHAPAAEWSN